MTPVLRHFKLILKEMGLGAVLQSGVKINKLSLYTEPV